MPCRSSQVADAVVLSQSATAVRPRVRSSEDGEAGMRQLDLRAGLPLAQLAPLADRLDATAAAG
ncbi:MAG: hypothetical protein H7A17_04245 [Sinobacteraceae bacterium]|nr:hypothetical protein [Nevskiaceae bacterium]